ncbi:testicular soluble adenylyl cyclase [Holotrichia oblita]|uniref:Testicular soluble adenylyl cyclase n=1 Tax=Holotrichia oblita TaxID=644536 RepID=A0ACB9TIV1_HOLOL|nr:testicular soluble adenylyl cyclase [Holotrichia oblita]
MAMENANNIDEESWPLFKEILDVDMCFIVMTINSSFINKLSEDAKKVMHHHNARTIQLSAIDKWYHAGLACQILEVRAIPADLEKVIQIRSNGNPGWIESFLISLVQGGGLNIKKVLKESLKDLGLVVPADEMLTSILSISSNSPAFDFNDISSSLTVVLIMKTYDSLSSYQQLLLKCSAVIGEMIPRDMLNYVMNQKNPRMTARAVQKLFEIRVLSCARGDFTQGDACVSFDMRLVNPNKDTAIKCDCKGIRIHETCLDLPKYASCGYFRFRLGAFRETTYNQLTDSQRKEFHGRAVRYLEKETRKCKACGNAFFVRILGVRYDEGMKKKLKKERGSRKAQRSATNNMDLQKKVSQFSAATSSTGSPSRSQNVNMSTGGESKYSALKKGSSDMLKQNCIAVTTIKRLRFRNSLTKTFSYADFSNCQCPQILASMYNQLIEHCEGSDLKDKLMDAMLEYAYLCIISYNIPQAIKILNRALTFLETQVTADIDDGTEWKIPLIRAKIEALFGRCKVELGEIAEAQQLFMKAMTDYGTFLRSEIEHSIELGFVMLRISSTIHAVTYSLQAMPILIQALIMRKRIMEAVTVLFELEYFAEEDIDNSGRTWYYALCIGIHLETGYTVIPYNQCERLYHIEGETMSTVRDPDAEKRYFTVMWSIRNDDWESATIWHSKIRNFSIGGGDQDSIANIFTALYLLEALLVFMVGKMDRRNIEAMSNAYKEIGILMKTLEKTLKVVKAIAPRFYHLKAYYKYIRYEENTAMSYLRKARNNAIKYENLLEESWLEHSEKAWTNSLSAVNADFWTEHCDPNNIIDYHEIDANNGRIGHYTLPTPLYI